MREPSELELRIAAELFPSKQKGWPFTATEESDFELPEGDDFGVPDVVEEELRAEAESTLQAEETGFGSVIGEREH